MDIFDDFDPLEERNHTRFWVKNKKVIETEVIHDATGKAQDINLARCATCSRVLHDIGEVAALCWVCDRELCTHDALPCRLCGQITCRKHAIRITQDIVACKTHNRVVTAALRAKVIGKWTTHAIYNAGKMLRTRS